MSASHPVSQAAVFSDTAVSQEPDIPGITRPSTLRHVRFADLFNDLPATAADADSARARPYVPLVSSSRLLDANSARARPYVSNTGLNNAFANSTQAVWTNALLSVSAAPIPTLTPASVSAPRIQSSGVLNAGTPAADMDDALVSNIYQTVLTHRPYLKAVGRWYKANNIMLPVPRPLEYLIPVNLRELLRRLKPLLDGLSDDFINSPDEDTGAPTSTVSPPFSVVQQAALGMPSMGQQAPFEHFPVLTGRSQTLLQPTQHARQEQVLSEGRGSGRIKMPPIPAFSGNQASSNPAVVLAWLRQTKLMLQQDGCTDPVTTAVLHLEGNAANWRDTVFLPLHSSLNPIPWIQFEEAFKARFMDRLSCMQALQAFRSLSMRPKQSVQDFNDLWLQRKLELLQMPSSYVSVPDEQSQIDSYLSTGLNQELSKHVQEHADYLHINELSYWMSHAVTTEAKLTTLKMRCDLARQGINSVHNDLQKKRSQDKPAQSGQAQKNSAGNPSKKARKGAASQYSGQAKSTGKARVKPGNQINTDHIDQYSDRDLRAPALSASKIAELKSAARMSVPSKNPSDSTRYPNMEYRLLNKRNCEANNLCYTCFGQIGRDHKAGDCPSSAFKANVSPPFAAAALATQSDPSTTKSTPHEGVQQVCMAATVQAVPFRNATMLFVGAV